MPTYFAKLTSTCCFNSAHFLSTSKKNLEKPPTYKKKAVPQISEIFCKGVLLVC